jgi:hypothetical protein
MDIAMTGEGNAVCAFLDKDGKVTRWPKKKSEKLEVLKYIQGKMERGRNYTEKEINGIIERWHSFHDYALLRRELYDNYLLERTPDGRAYWIARKNGSAAG